MTLLRVALQPQPAGRIRSLARRRCGCAFLGPCPDRGPGPAPWSGPAPRL